MNLKECTPERLCTSDGIELYHDLITIVNIVNKPQFKDFKMFKRYRFDKIFLAIVDYIYENKEDLTLTYNIRKKEPIENEGIYCSRMKYFGPIDSTEYETNFQTIYHFYPQPDVNQKINYLIFLTFCLSFLIM